MKSLVLRGLKRLEELLLHVKPSDIKSMAEKTGLEFEPAGPVVPQCTLNRASCMAM